MKKYDIVAYNHSKLFTQDYIFYLGIYSHEENGLHYLFKNKDLTETFKVVTVMTFDEYVHYKSELLPELDKKETEL